MFDDDRLKGRLMGLLDRLRRVWKTTHAASVLEFLLGSAFLAGGVILALSSDTGTSHEVGLVLGGAGLGAILAVVPLWPQERDNARAEQELEQLRGQTEQSGAMARLGTTSNHDGVDLAGLWVDTKLRAYKHSFRGAYLAGTRFPPGSDFTGADFTGAIMDKATFTGVLLREAICSNSKASEARFDDASLADAVFCGATLKKAVFDGVSDIEGADFSCADLSGSTWRRVEINRACFYGALFSGDFAAGPYADFTGTHFVLVDFRYADLAFCDFDNTTLAQIPHSAAFMLDHALLLGANLERCEALRASSLKDALADGSTRWPSGFDWKGKGVLSYEDLDEDKRNDWFREQMQRREERAARRTMLGESD